MTDAYRILAVLLAIALVVSVVAAQVKRRRPESLSIANLSARTRSWVVLLLVCWVVLLAGRTAVILLFAFVSFLALREYLAQTCAGRADHRTLLLCFFLLLPGQYVLIGFPRYEFFSLWIPVAGFLAVSVTSALSGEMKQFLERTTQIYWGLIACVYSISYIPALLSISLRGFTRRPALLMVFLVLIAQSSDILQYAWGKLMGRHRLMPAISPSKSVEGLVGGFASTTVIGALLAPITPFTPPQSAAMALLIALLGFFGGMVMSAIKRDRGIKDWSGLIEGHGGMLDRIDSLIFSAPVFFYVTRYFFSGP